MFAGINITRFAVETFHILLH